MNVVDLLIIIFLLFGALIGFKRGFTKQLFSFVGLILVVVLAFILKNPVSVLLYENLPFFDFSGIFKGVSVLNILLYEVLAFFLVLAVLLVALRILLFVSGIFEKLLNMTIILGIPSKILGAIIGILENFIIVFVLLYILTLPIFHIDGLGESKLKKQILTKTPILSTYVSKSVDVVDKFLDLKDKYTESTDANAFNLEALDVFLEYKVITVDSVETLLQKGKLEISNIDSVLDKYKEE